jgi:hypothetical protein
MMEQKKTPTIRDVDVWDGNKLICTIHNAKSYVDAVQRAEKELNLPLLQSGYSYRNTYYRTGKHRNNGDIEPKD